MLNWDDSKGSGKAENDRNSLDYVPLAQWDHLGSRFSDRGGCTVPDDTFVGDDLEPSVWVKRMVIGFGKFVGFPMDSSERQCLTFFQQLESCRKSLSNCFFTFKRYKGITELSFFC